MREIKFRGKHIHAMIINKHLNGTWVYGYLSDDRHIYNKETCDFYVNPDTVGQYTGFKDKNGKEIYEGDIVAFEDMTSTERGYSEHYCTGKVVWDEETASFQVTDRLSAESYEVLQECEVIGNIYNNPELEVEKLIGEENKRG